MVEISDLPSYLHRLYGTVCTISDFLETILGIFAEGKVNIFVYFSIETDNHWFITDICIQHQDRFFVSVAFINAIDFISL